MIDDYDILDPNVRKQSYLELNVTLLSIADCLERHEFFKVNWETYVPGPPHFRGLATEIHDLGVGADRGDSVMKAKREEARDRAELSIDVATKYMVVRAVEQKNPGLLQETGVPYKVKKAKSKNKSKGSGASVTITLTAVHLKGVSGGVILKGKHLRSGGPYMLQICKGEPVSEESWYSPGGDYSSCNKIILKNLDPANRYYFRIRTDGPEGPGPWSQVVSLIVL